MGAIPQAPDLSHLSSLREAHRMNGYLALRLGKIMPRLVLFICLAIAGPMGAVAEEPSAPMAAEVSYSKQIQPIFRTHCQGCHQPAKQGGGYVMTAFASLLQGGESGEAAIVAGQPAASALIAQITPDAAGKASMPKDSEKALTAVEIELISQWIAQGAKDDSPVSTRAKYDMEHPPVYAGAPAITSIRYSVDGALLAISGYHEVLLHKADGSSADAGGPVARLVGLSERIESAAFSPDGKYLAVSGGSPGRFGEIQIWDLAEKKLRMSSVFGYDTLYGASWSPNGKMVSFGCSDNTVRAIDAESGKQVVFNGAHNDWVLDTAFSVNSDHLVSVSRDMSMKLTEVATQRFVDNITSITPGALKGGLSTIDRHPTKDEFLVGGSDGAPKIFKMLRTTARVIGDNANLIREFPALPGRVYGVAFSRDGNRIVAGSSSDGAGQVRIYEAADGKLVSQTEVPAGGIFAVAFNHDGTQVAAAGFDGQVRLINVADGKILKQFLPVAIEPAVAAK
jgi:mono/diheme cytochrome c family protein